MSTIVFALKNVKLDVPSVLQAVYEQVAESTLQSASRAINQALQQHVDEKLQRAPYARREHT